jgi:Family of unknown function (DUF5681)
MEITKFKPGQSGNPNGRPKDKTPATLIRKSIADGLPEIIKALIAKAKEGDVAAAKVLLDRVCPALKPQALPISLRVNGGLVEQGDEVIRATLAGEIPPDIGSQLIAALSNQGKLIDLEELADRLKRIERQLEAG